MTHSGGKPHSNVGDIGQRYEVRSTGYPKAGESVFGWSDTLDGAASMAAVVRQAPGCTSTTIFDREKNEPVITQYAGILR